MAWEDCAICLISQSELRKLSCGHTFHGSCIQQWEKRCNTCPICRRPISRKGLLRRNAFVGSAADYTFGRTIFASSQPSTISTRSLSSPSEPREPSEPRSEPSVLPYYGPATEICIDDMLALTLPLSIERSGLTYHFLRAATRLSLLYRLRHVRDTYT